MSASAFHPNEWVFIGYTDHACTEEAGRMYPVTEEDYYECMEDAGNLWDFWICVPRTDERATA